MGNHGRLFIVAAAAAVAGGVLTTALATRTEGQTRTDGVARMPDNRPNLNGIWQVMNTANWDLEDHQARAGYPQLGAIGAVPPGQGVVEGGDIPYQPAALTRSARTSRTAAPKIPRPSATCLAALV